jgi:hypothetical protein
MPRRSQEKHTNISFMGTREEVEAVSLLALQNKSTIGKMVREALFARYGDEIKTTLLFFENSAHRNEQSPKSVDAHS